MRINSTLTVATDQTSAYAQAAFRSEFDHTPLIDVRTPAMVAAQKLAEGWR